MFSSKPAHELDVSVNEKLNQLKVAREKASAPNDQSTPLIVNGFIPNSNLNMKAIGFNGKESVSLNERKAPAITQAFDAIVKITSTTICGSDLHFYFDVVPGRKLEKGYIVGHEAVGYVTEVGSDVKKLKPGDRVVIGFPISCGDCSYCKKKQPTLCDRANPEPDSQVIFGNKLGGLFGYGYSSGGFAGLQAEYARVPVADVNVLKVPENLKDSEILGLSDILCTGWHGLELAEVKADDVVVIWGVGPVGLATLYLAKKLRNVSRVVCIDFDEYRLGVAKSHGAEIICRENIDIKKKLLEMFPSGQDVSIDCTGEFPSILQSVSNTLYPHDPSGIADEMIYTTKKGGRVSLIRAYFSYTNFPIGPLMEKAITVRGGQAWVSTYWDYLLEKIVDKTIEPSFIFSHVMPFEKIVEAYKKFADHEDKCLKVILQTAYGREKHGSPHTGMSKEFQGEGKK